MKRINNSNKGVALVSVILVFLVAMTFAMMILHLSRVDNIQGADIERNSGDYYIAWSGANLMQDAFVELVRTGTMPDPDAFYEALYDGKNYAGYFSASGETHMVSINGKDIPVTISLKEVSAKEKEISPSTTAKEAILYIESEYFDASRGEYAPAKASLSMRVEIHRTERGGGGGGNLGGFMVQRGGEYYFPGGDFIGGRLIPYGDNYQKYGTSWTADNNGVDSLQVLDEFYSSHYSGGGGGDYGVTVVPPVLLGKMDGTSFKEGGPRSDVGQVNWLENVTTYGNGAPIKITGTKRSVNTDPNSPVVVDPDYFGFGGNANRLLEETVGIILQMAKEGFPTATAKSASKSITELFAKTGLNSTPTYTLTDEVGTSGKTFASYFDNAYGSAGGGFLPSLKWHIMGHPEFVEDILTPAFIPDITINVPSDDNNAGVMVVEFKSGDWQWETTKDFAETVGQTDFDSDTTIIFRHKSYGNDSDFVNININSLIKVAPGCELTLMFDRVYGTLTFGPNAEFASTSPKSPSDLLNPEKEFDPSTFAQINILVNPIKYKLNSANLPYTTDDELTGSRGWPVEDSGVAKSINPKGKFSFDGGTGILGEESDTVIYFGINTADLPKNHIDSPIHIYAPESFIGSGGNVRDAMFYGNMYAKYISPRDLTISYIPSTDRLAKGPMPGGINYINVPDDPNGEDGDGEDGDTTYEYSLKGDKTSIYWVLPD